MPDGFYRLKKPGYKFKYIILSSDNRNVGKLKPGLLIQVACKDFCVKLIDGSNSRPNAIKQSIAFKNQDKLLSRTITSQPK